MVFKDDDEMVYQTFMAEYRCSPSYNKGFGWKVFLENKNLGIEHHPDHYDMRGTSLYKIVDEKKWMLTRIKYGI